MHDVVLLVLYFCLPALNVYVLMVYMHLLSAAYLWLLFLTLSFYLAIAKVNSVW